MINLYGACVRVGRAMGYRRIITYTLESEHGSSVKAANFKYDGIAGGLVWSGKRRNDALPGGDMKEVFETVKTNNYMGWKPCTMEEDRRCFFKHHGHYITQNFDLSSLTGLFLKNIFTQIAIATCNNSQKSND